MTLLSRLAQAKGPDRELAAAVMRALGHRVESDDGDFWYGPHDQPPQRVPDLLASLDAVLSLLPEGWRFGFEMAGRYDANDLCEAWAWPYESGFDPDWRNGDQGYRSAPDGHRAAHKDVVNAALQVILRARGIE